jgi:type IV pilus assembly protein PilE
VRRGGIVKPPSHAARCAGITLIELCCASAVVAVLSVLALPNLQSGLHKARRADAWVAAMRVELAQEHFRSRHASYGELPQIGAAHLSPSGHYQLSVLSATSSGYRLVAAAVGAQARDSVCRYLVLQVDDGTASHASGPDTAATNTPADNKRCWGR